MNLVIMGVCGCGKSTVGERLATALNADFIEGDSFHPLENVQRMSAGTPLTDADRAPWLSRLAQELATANAAGRSKVLSCSALKRRYREQLAASGPVTFVYLQGTRDEIERRMALRQNHFMVASMVASQFEALEEPAPDEPCIRVSILQTVDQIVDQVLKALETT
ncbi:gluconokinase [Marinobacterium nitratireducens]|uniref:Gluconokinase n=1 Tax=Marinobacterium nitratireducens TaxID=518897 RepID=A0A917ZHB8_9GAMM|nr:gluconokinase [Marinobacterium nitratireducens]GGO82793.1 gluconokinase [Marinobacterium nitratireducens]